MTYKRKVAGPIPALATGISGVGISSVLPQARACRLAQP
jgi:hypothetical protein